MINVRSFWRALPWLAACGMCLPVPVIFGAERGEPLVRDIALSQGGLLVGQVLDQTMRPVRGARVAIQTEGHTAASTVTDDAGVFAVAGLRGGVHQVVTDKAVEDCRLWATGTAPPRAAAHLRFVPGQGNVIRGQWGPPKNAFTNWATNPWVVGGVVATAIAVPVVLNNIDDDDDGS